jgi:hypothetical protein
MMSATVIVGKEEYLVWGYGNTSFLFSAGGEAHRGYLSREGILSFYSPPAGAPAT